MHYLVPSLIYETVLMTLFFEAVWSAGCRLANRLPDSNHSGLCKPCGLQSILLRVEWELGKLWKNHLPNSQWLIFFNGLRIWTWEENERHSGLFSLWIYSIQESLGQSSSARGSHRLLSLSWDPRGHLLLSKIADLPTHATNVPLFFSLCHSKHSPLATVLLHHT